MNLSAERIVIRLKAQTGEGLWIVDAILHRMEADDFITESREQSWQVACPICSYDPLADALPGIVRKLGEGLSIQKP